MTITFDSGVKHIVTKWLGTLRGRNCHFCGTPLNQDNFAGAVKTENGKLAMFCGILPCLLELSDMRKSKH